MYCVTMQFDGLRENALADRDQLALAGGIKF